MEYHAVLLMIMSTLKQRLSDVDTIFVAYCLLGVSYYAVFLSE